MSKSKNTLIFIVDDDIIQRELLKDHLTLKTKYKLRAFSSGEECLENMSLKPSIIFLDYDLSSSNSGSKNGMEILGIIKKLHPATEVVMFSGQEKIEVAVNTMVNGAFDYIIKSESAFVRAENVVNNILQQHELQRQNKIYKVVVIALISIIGFLAVATFAAYQMGYISDRQVGGTMF